MKKLVLENLENRILLAPVAPTDLELWYADGSEACGNIISEETPILKLAADAGMDEVRIYNSSTGMSYLGNATSLAEPVFYGYDDGGEHVVVIEAEDGILSSMNTTVGGGSVGSYIYDNNTDGSSTYNFYISTTDTYYLHARTSYPDGSHNSFYINIDDTWASGETGPAVWDNDGPWNTWKFDTATTIANGGAVKTWSLQAGWHTLEVHARESLSKIDRIVISTDSDKPGGIGGVESTNKEFYEYTFDPGELIGSAAGTENIIIARAVDFSGTSPDSTGLSITYDDGVIVPGTPDLDSGSDTGTSDSDDTTNDTTATFTGGAGSVEDDATVWLRVGGVNTRSTTAAGNGSYSITLEAGDLAEGANVIDIFYIDPAGNTSVDSDNLTVTLDTLAAAPEAAPDLTAGSDTGTNTDNITRDTTPTFVGTGTVEADSTVWVRVNGVNTRSGTADGSGDYSVTMTEGDLNEGINNIDIVYIDKAGNTSADSANLSVTLDTLLADPSTPDLTAATDTGSSDVDNITGIATLSFQGYAEPNSSVQLLVNGMPKGAAIPVNASGYWTGNLAGTNFSQGSNDVLVAVSDTAGNNEVSSVLEVFYDNVDPAQPGKPDLIDGDDSGGDNGDDITNVIEPTITGTAEVASSVEIDINAGAHTDTVIVRSDGTWSYDIPAGWFNDNADNTVFVTATDTAGNSSLASDTLTITIDTNSSGAPVAPDLAAASDTGYATYPGYDTDNWTNDTTPTFTGGAGSVEAGATVVVRRVGSSEDLAGTTAAGDGSYSITLDAGDLVEGDNDVYIRVTEQAGNMIDSAAITVCLDTTAAAPAGAPDLAGGDDSGDANDDNITNVETATFTGTVPENNSQVWLRVGGVNVRSTTDTAAGTYSIDLQAGDLQEGSNTVDMVYVDPAGNISGDSPDLTVTLDTTAADPAGACDLVAGSDTGVSGSDNITNETRPDLSAPAGSVQAYSTVHLLVNGAQQQDTTADQYGGWLLTLDGDYLTNLFDNQITYYYTDPAGNDSAESAALGVYLDTTVADPSAPDLAEGSDTGSSSTDNVTTETRPTIFGGPGSVENNSTVHIWLDTPAIAPAIETGTVTAGADGSWSYTFPGGYPLQEGVNAIYVVAVDVPGNESNASGSLNVTVSFDLGSELPPELLASSDTGSANNDRITQDDTLSIFGTCPAGAVVKVRSNNTTIDQFTDNDADDEDPAAGQWQYTFPAAVLQEGVNTIDFLTIDTSDNATDWSLDLIILLDTGIEKPTLPNLVTADDTGSSSGDNLTYIKTPALQGTAEAGSTVTIQVNANSDTTTAGVDGIWNYTIPLDTWLSEGDNDITVQALDAAGNLSIRSDTLTVELDTSISVPVITGLTAATDTGTKGDQTTSHANPRILGTADADTTLTVRIDGALCGTILTDDAGDWNYTFANGALQEGVNAITVLSTDAAGNSATSAGYDITRETVISIPADLDLLASSDKGSLDNDDITSFETPVISGTCDPGSDIYVRVNGTEIGTVADGDDGSSDGLWYYTFAPGDLIEGVNIVDAKAEDEVGNLSDYSIDLVITLDTAIADPAAPELDQSTDSGASDRDRYTNEANAVITGFCEEGATVLIKLNGNDSFDQLTDDDGDGRWQYTFAGGLVGSNLGSDNTISIAQQDIAGNVSGYSPILTVTLDSGLDTPSMPDLLPGSDTGDSNTDNQTNLSYITVTGDAEPDSTARIYVDQGGGRQLVDTLSGYATAGGTWSYTFSYGQLAEGINRVSVQVTDRAGNVSAYSDELMVTLDTSIATPSIPDLVDASDTGQQNDDEVTSDTTPTFSGTAQPFSHIMIRVDGEEVATVDTDGTGLWSYTFIDGEIQNGVRRIDTFARDAAGNESAPSEDLTIWLNVAPTQPASPNLVRSSDSGQYDTDNLTNISQAVIEGKADTDVQVEIYVDTVLVGIAQTSGQGFWEYTFYPGQLQQGQNHIYVITEDTSGQRSLPSYELVLQLDTTDPEAPVPDLNANSDTGSSQEDNFTSDRTATIQGQCEPYAGLELFVNDQSITSLTTTSSGQWSYTFAPDLLLEGENAVYVVLTDQAGNISEPSDSLIITLDMQEDSPHTPAVSPDTDTGLSDSDALTNNPRAEIFGQAKAGSTVAIYLKGENVAETQADQQGNWTYKFDEGTLAQGVNFIEILSTDLVGNITRSGSLELTLDTTAPVLYNYFPRGNHTKVTDSIELYIQGGDLDFAATQDIRGYELIGSGGDGQFAQGNEWTIPIESIVVDEVSGLVQIYTGLTLTDDTYQLILYPEVSLRDQAGNAMVLPTELLGSVSESKLLFDTESVTIIFEIDTAGPPAPTQPQLNADSDSGISDQDRITNRPQLLVETTDGENLAVELICNGVSAGFASEITPGRYQLPIGGSLLREGENFLLARAYDDLGNCSDLSQLQNITFDTQGPEVSAIVVDEIWYDLGPRQISIVLNEANIDPDSILDVSNYVLIAAGGDGGFQGGNELEIPITAAQYDSQSHSILLTLPQTATGTSQLGPDLYRLSLSGETTITDAAGNLMSSTAQQEFLVIQTIVIDRYGGTVIQTADGQRISVSLKGPGQTRIVPGFALGSDYDIERILLQGTNENSILRIKGAPAGDDITVGSILSDSSLRALIAGTVNVMETVQIEQGLRICRLNGLGPEVAAALSAPLSETATGLDLRINEVEEGADIDVQGYLRMFRCFNFDQAALHADSAGTIRIDQGDTTNSNIEIREGDLNSFILTKTDLKGTLSVQGRLGRLQLGRNDITGQVQAGSISRIQADDLSGAAIHSDGGIEQIKADSGSNLNITSSGDCNQLYFRNSLAASQIFSAGNINRLHIGGDAIDNLILAGSDPGPDRQLDGVDDLFGNASIGQVRISGRYQRTIVSVGVNPGEDLLFFTEDDTLAGLGDIQSVRFSGDSLELTSSEDDPFGILAGGSIGSAYISGGSQLAPYQIDAFVLRSFGA